MVAAVSTPKPSHVIAAGVVWPIVGAIVVGLRFYSRRIKSVRSAVDDWLTVPALVLLWGQGACLITGVAVKALGYPTPPPPAGDNPITYNTYQSRVARQLLWAVLLMQIPALTFIKCSFVFLYRRIFNQGHREHRNSFNVVTWTIVGTLIAWAIAFFFCELFLCGSDFESIWITKSLIAETACIQLLPWDIAFTSTDFILDLIIFILPIRPIFRLELSRSQKFSLLGVFALGGLAIAASITRLAIFVGGDEYDSSITTDTDLVLTTVTYWSVTESGLALLANCLPSIYGFFNVVRQNSKKDGSYPVKSYTNITRRNDSESTWAGRSNLSANESGKGNGKIHLTRDIRVDVENGYHMQDLPKRT